MAKGVGTWAGATRRRNRSRNYVDLHNVRQRVSMNPDGDARIPPANKLQLKTSPTIILSVGVFQTDRTIWSSVRSAKWKCLITAAQLHEHVERKYLERFVKRQKDSKSCLLFVPTHQT